MLQNLINSLPEWTKASGEADDVAISSRIRLARNLKGIPFPNKANDQQLTKVVETIENAVSRQSDLMIPIKIENLSANQRLIMVEKHLCSPQFIEKPHYRMLVINKEQTISLMVNEEDHLRIQTISPGFNLESALNQANHVDDFLEETLDYSFDETCGFLTSCPTNVGTGIRASVMLHLPGLAMVDQIKQVLSALTQLGINIRGLYGEGTESLGNIYQISNQVTLGHSEEELTNNLTSVCRQVIEQERSVRKALMKDSRLQLEDRLCRSYGLLTQARLMNTQEALKLLSDVKLGIDLGIIPEAARVNVKELLFLIRTSILQHIYGKEMNQFERDYHRAMTIREKLASV